MKELVILKEPIWLVPTLGLPSEKLDLADYVSSRGSPGNSAVTTEIRAGPGRVRARLVMKRFRPLNATLDGLAKDARVVLRESWWADPFAVMNQVEFVNGDVT